MKTKTIRIFKLLLLFITIFLYTCNISFADSANKTILIITDHLDFSTIEKLEIANTWSLGLMNTRTSNVFDRSSESYFMTIATGRRVEVKKGLFKEIRYDSNGSLYVDGYKDIINNLDKNYTNFSKKIEFMSDTLTKNGVSIGYLGNDISSLVAANRNGVIQFGHPLIEYDRDWLIKKSKDTLDNSDVLILSYNIDNKENRLKILKEYIEQFSKQNIIIFPSKVTGDVDDLRNGTLVPVLYYNPSQNSGILTSNSTKRIGIITNMDIFSEIADIYNIDLNTSTGHEIYSIEEPNNKSEIIEANKDNLNSILNFIIIKYIFHGIVVVAQLYIIYDIFKRKNNLFNKYNILMNGILVSIFLSILLGFFNLGQNIVLYLITIIALTICIVLLMEKNNKHNYVFFPISTNMLILIGVYFKPDIIYNSFYGFNNVVSGGRFYGLNNETMGILLVTSIITFFFLKRRVKNKLASILILLIYFPIVILALSDKYAANFGGYITSISLFLMLIYATIFNKKVSKKNLFSLVTIGITIFLLGFVIELFNSPNGHIGSFYSRIVTLGVYELIDMVIKKIKQLLLTAISPPWNIISFAQIYFIFKFLLKSNSFVKNMKSHYHNITVELIIIFLSSIIAFILNDTGVVAFVYMNTFVIAKLINIRAKNYL